MSEAKRVSTKQKTGRTASRNTKKVKSIPLDTICIECTDSANGDLINMIRFAGFDKKTNSTRESFFISNSSAHTLHGIVLNLTYTTLDGRELHSRDVEIKCLVPPGTSRNVTVPSWDTQKSFYYHHSDPPRKGTSTPFEVTIIPHRFTIERVPDNIKNGK